MTPASLFHPAVAAWFAGRFAAPTAAQAQAWPSIKAGRPTLIAAPTGSGKTLAAFLAAIDELLRDGLDGRLADETRIVYVSPLKALSNDMKLNLEAPLAGIRAALRAQGLPDVEIRTLVRSGDTPPAEREKMRRRPPHILVTTPESLYVLLGSESGRAALSTTRTVIVDEIHAMAPNKRGAHLALSLERLAALSGDRLLRIGLSATQNPIEAIARLLVGAGPDGGAAAEVAIVDAGHNRPRDLALEVPSSPLEAVMSAEVWEQVYERLAQLIEAHRTTLVFVNTRRMAERVARHLSERLGEAQVAAHHGSMAKEHRLSAEQRLKHGALKALVATASLELGIDIGEVDLVCQLGSPRSIASFLQRVGRSGHAVDGLPKGRLFPQSRDELVECAALLDSVRRGELDRLTIPERPLDVLAQQIVAEVAAQDWPEAALYARVRRAWPYRDLPREDFSALRPYARRRLHDAARPARRADPPRRGQRHAARPARRAADRADLGRHDPRHRRLQGGAGAGQSFDRQRQRGLRRRERRRRRFPARQRRLSHHPRRARNRRVEDAHGQAPNIPFWLGEAPARSDELSRSVSRLRATLGALLKDDPSGKTALAWLAAAGIGAPAAEQIVEYLAAAQAALGALPTQEQIAFERFFDEAGGMQLVIHSPYGSRINRAWGLALRKRFCRKFNFELQAAATEDNILLSLTTAHSFELGDVARYLNSNNVRPVLIQAMLDAPMFTTRWRWVAGVSLALPRMRGGRKVAPQLARMDAEDLIAAVFPDQIACAENLVGEREIPDHPLTRQTIDDCLHEAMDIVGLERLLTRLESGEVDAKLPRPHRAVAAGAGGAVRAPLRLPRRRAARRAPHPGGDGAAVDGAGERRRHRPARRRGDRTGARRSLARRRQRRGAARRAAVARLSHGGGGARRARMGRMARGARAGQAHNADRDAARRVVDRRGAVAFVRGGVARRAAVARGRAAGRCGGQELEPRRGAGRDRARTAGRARPGRAGGAHRLARAGEERDRRGADSAAGRGLRHARAFYAGRRGRGMVRAAPARPHPPLPPSSGCAPRSSRSRRATSCASCFPGSAPATIRASKGRRRSPRSSPSSKGSRRRRGPGRPRFCRPASRATSPAGSTTNASPGASSGRG